MILATYDGAYLHLWKYELFNRKESRFEHMTHTIRAILFPLMVWLLFVSDNAVSFYVGLGLLVVDLIVLGIDAFSEQESRAFMNGLPRSEYIVHLFANGFHFASIILIIATKIEVQNEALFYSKEFLAYSSFETVQFIAVNILPGAIVLGIVHLLLSFDFGRKVWNSSRVKIKCC